MRRLCKLNATYSLQEKFDLRHGQACRMPEVKLPKFEIVIVALGVGRARLSW